ncbi:radical SAM protein [Rhodocyclus tenuis]|uniref:radical SAM protein n=1 Tax=Rhodocyclus gracilis TaxID=2929842 RepID=UPI001298CF66|nr:radical SAM protein [Rhodocyclus gracilis]MRD73049.1 radical SAM protein [Rhodocyclus gracilis]
MFKLARFYDDAITGTTADIAGLVDYLKTFDALYIWGAGYLGDAVGAKLLEIGVPVTAYWDTRHESLASLHEIPVLPTFTSRASPERTGVVFCISSSFVMEHCLSELKRHGFAHRIQGDMLYAGLICPLDDQSTFKTCRDANACDVYTCRKNEYFHKRWLGVPENEPGPSLYFKNITFVINQICTLKCKYCYSYTNAYPDESRKNFPLAQILSDIDKTFDAIDGVKIVPLIGGETFLHPDLSLIVKKFLEKSNFGILNVTTNGIVKIHDRQLEGLADSRIQVVFSNYKASLSAKEGDLFDRNVERVRANGAQVIVMNETPQWTVPTTLWDRNYPLETMKQKRRDCLNPLICKYVKNGKFYPCTVADSIYNIGVADYPQDYVTLDADRSREALRGEIRTLLARSYFDSCRHCDGVCGTTGVTALAGEQGHYEVVKLPMPTRLRAAQ